MVNEKEITVVFDTRNVNFENGQQFNSLVDQVNEVLKSGRLYRDIEITQWEMYHEGNEVKGEENIHVPFHRHFYHDPAKNVFGGGFMLFEVLEDLRRYYKVDDFTDGLPWQIDLVFTVTVTLVESRENKATH